MYASVHGLDLWYERRGSGAPVVLLHGIGDSHELWRHQMGPFSENHDVIAMDIPGHGRSDLMETDFTLDDVADQVAGTIQALRLRSPVIIGLSMGGGVAQSIAVRNPRLPQALVLVSTSSELPEASRRRMTARADRAELEGMAAVVEETVRRWFTPEFVRRHPDEVAHTRRTVLGTSSRGFAAVSRANAERSLTSRLGRISCPVLFIGGADDPGDPYRSMTIYRQGVARFESEIIPNASHLVPVEAPTIFNDVVLCFLAEVGSTTEAARGEEA